RLDLPIGVPARNWALVVNGSWVGLLDQIHSAGGLTFRGTPRSRRVLAAVVDHVPGVLGVTQHVTHRPFGPGATSAGSEAADRVTKTIDRSAYGLRNPNNQGHAPTHHHHRARGCLNCLTSTSRHGSD